ncbi:MAG: LamG domain-containing protein [Opitutaceae bacterium]|jgi:hypothetical protein|nr:LamG domain-containing protein [Opitutaceae bacterium]
MTNTSHAYNHTRNGIRFIHAMLLAVTLATGAVSVFAAVTVPAPLLEFLFNEASGTTTTGTTTTGTGSGSTGTVATYQDSTGAAASLHSADTFGVSGQAGDYAFDNTASTGMGSAGTGGRVYAGNVATAQGLTSFTLQGWFYSDTQINGAARLLDDQSGGAQGFGLRADNNAGRLVLTVNSTSSAASAASYTQTNQWVFFAVTYDGSQTSSNVNFYIGTTTSGVSLVGTHTLNAGQSQANLLPLVIGNSTGSNNASNINNRPFDGYLDNIRVYGSVNDNTGVLGIAQLEAIRSSDVTPVPEPVTTALLGGAGMLLIAVIMRRKHIRL